MMNQYYGFGGRSNRQSADRAPYRRPNGRNGISGEQVGRVQGIQGMQGNMPGNMHGNMPGNMHGNMPGNMPGGMPGGMPDNMQGGMNERGSGHGGNRNAPRPGCRCGLSTEGHGFPPAGTQRTASAFGPVEGRGGCGCTGAGNADNAACKRLMEQIRAVDFALYETVLYLDVYPQSCDALETYHKLRAQSKALHDEYEITCGPLTAFGNRSDTSWDWMSKPCPWEYDAD